MGIRLLVTAAVGHIKKYFNTQHIEIIKMYFVTEQFYQLPSEGIFSLISSLFGQSAQTKKEDRHKDNLVCWSCILLKEIKFNTITSRLELTEVEDKDRKILP